ncbi:hypothetical protein [Pseudooceanicola nanhaiensis]|uniref:hypothetical protein n=1 Tax=Pseudooceanicola nanhaiensis TaxID=375761 RepID=UPI001CD5033A|nr:hypothetical protein [Pseudooceanicola nanhaiensis]MCA0919205.1 hypothetical protein [Pseudooceanicola nanhaiensis]
MFGYLQWRLGVALKKSALGAVGLVLMLVGLAFLTVAGWILLATTYDTLIAATVIGCVYFGLGLVFLGFAMRRPRMPVPPTPVAAPMAAMPGLMGAFLQGLSAGRAARGTPPPPPPPPPHTHC